MAPSTARCTAPSGKGMVRRLAIVFFTADRRMALNTSLLPATVLIASRGEGHDPRRDVAHDLFADVARRVVFGRYALAGPGHEQVVQGGVGMEGHVGPVRKRRLPTGEFFHRHLVVPLPLEHEHRLFHLRCGGRRIVPAQIEPIRRRGAENTFRVRRVGRLQGVTRAITCPI